MLAYLVFEKTPVRILYILRQIDEKGEHGRRVGKLGRIFDADVFPFIEGGGVSSIIGRM